MKTLIKLTGLFLLFFVGCTSDPIWDEAGIPASLTSKNKAVTLTQEPQTVTVPMKMNFASTPSTDTMVPCLPSDNIYVPEAGLISGTATHLGRIQEAESTYKITSCSFDQVPDSDPVQYQLTTIFDGKITAANGDYYNYTGTIITKLSDASFTGNIEVNDGTGRFKGVTGSITIVGKADFTTGALNWTGNGTLTFITGNDK